jgi:hypothetical protein
LWFILGHERNESQKYLAKRTSGAQNGKPLVAPLDKVSLTAASGTESDPLAETPCGSPPHRCVAVERREGERIKKEEERED